MYNISETELNFAVETIDEIIQSDEVHSELAEVSELLKYILEHPVVVEEEVAA